MTYQCTSRANGQSDAPRADWQLHCFLAVKRELFGVMRFRNREEAAQLLTERLAAYRGHHPLVLGVPRGAVPMARIISDALGGDLDVVLVRKLRAPEQPELAIGAVDEAGRVLKGAYFSVASDEYIREEIRTQQEILRKRRELYTEARQAVNPAGRVVILVDDGVATGSSMLSAIRSVRAAKPQKIVVAIGVAPSATLPRLRQDADEVVCLYATDAFYAVGQFFDEFSEVTDDMVVAALAGPRTREARQPA
jgi:predicted phosphoribosyltransferase